MLNERQFNAFRREAEELLTALAGRYGADVKAGKIKFGDSSFNLDIKVTKKSVNGKPYEQVEFEKYCKLYDFKSEDYKKQFVHDNKIFTITGFNPKASVRPINCADDNGKKYKFPLELAKRLLKESPKTGITVVEEKVSWTAEQAMDALLDM